MSHHLELSDRVQETTIGPFRIGVCSGRTGCGTELREDQWSVHAQARHPGERERLAWVKWPPMAFWYGMAIGGAWAPLGYLIRAVI